MMKWLCCCTCCWPAKKDKIPTLDDASSLIPDGQTVAGAPTPVQDFYVPRRHSSFNTSTYAPVSVQPGRSQSDSCSSSGDEDAPPLEQRARCWSTIPATSATDVTSLIAPRPAAGREFTSCFNTRSMGSVLDFQEHNKGFAFDKHALSEISETEPGAENEAEDDQKTDAEVYGYLSFVTTYDEQEQRLTVFLDKATDLPRKGTLPPYGTFVKLTLTSSRKNFRLSRAVRNALSPAYKEEHIFHTNRSKWKASRQNVLRLSVYESDRQGRHDAIGHAIVPLCKLDGVEEEHCLPLTPMSVPVKYIGQLLTGLFYSATQSRLSIHVIKARHLKTDPEIHKKHLRPLQREICDTFVKVTLMCGGQKVKTTRSRVVVDSPDPFYNHKCSFVVPPQFLLDSSLVVTVMLRGVLGRSTALGRVTAGPYTETGEEAVLTHWGRMAQDTRSIVQWRNLYL